MLLPNKFSRLIDLIRIPFRLQTSLGWIDTTNWNDTASWSDNA